jgi:hypothetical protein
VCGLPKLIAACHVLHRLSLPRHPPCALSSLTIELTPRREPNRFGPVRINLFSASEIGLARSRVQSPILLKTLFLLEHLPESLTCSNSLHVLGLVFNTLGVLHAPLRLAAAESLSKLVTQSISLSNIHTFSLFRKGPALGRLKPACIPLVRATQACFVIEASRLMREAPITKQRMSLGGADRDRTGDPLLAKQVLSQLSYSPTFQGGLRLRWWAWVESNYRPHPYQGCALTN